MRNFQIFSKFFTLSFLFMLMIPGSSGLAANVGPDNCNECPTAACSADFVSVNPDSLMVSKMLNTQYADGACYCLNKHFCAPSGQRLTYSLILRDEAGNQVPGWNWKSEQDWIYKAVNPPYITFIPGSTANLGTHLFMVNATNGTDVASDKFRISVGQYNNVSPFQKWVSIGSGLAAFAGAVSAKVVTIRKAMDPTSKFVHSYHPWSGIGVGALVGGVGGATIGWGAELLKIAFAENPQDAIASGTTVVVVPGVVCLILGAIAVPFIARKYRPEGYNPVPNNPATVAAVYAALTLALEAAKSAVPRQ